MVVPPSEVAVNRRLTAVFIAADLKMVTLHRPVKTPTGTGGYSSDSIDLAPQEARLLPIGTQAQERVMLDGSFARPNYSLMMRFNADVAAGDSFEDDGEKYTIIWVQAKRDYQTKAEVIQVGRV